MTEKKETLITEKIENSIIKGMTILKNTDGQKGDFL